MIGTTNTDMIIQNIMTIGLVYQIVILHSMITNATIAMITILHPTNSGKVKAKTSVTEIHVVTIEILTTNVVTEAKTEVIVRTIMTIR